MDKSEIIRIRIGQEEKKAFLLATELSGLSLSAWMRERLRRAAIRELEEAAIPVDFLLPKQERIS